MKGEQEVRKKEEVRNMILPQFRFNLKAELHRAGFRTMKEFAEAIHVDVYRISRIVNGWELPSPKLAKAMSEGLGITIADLRGLL